MFICLLVCLFKWFPGICREIVDFCLSVCLFVWPTQLSQPLHRPRQKKHRRHNTWQGEILFSCFVFLRCLIICVPITVKISTKNFGQIIKQISNMCGKPNDFWSWFVGRSFRKQLVRDVTYDVESRMRHNRLSCSDHLSHMPSKLIRSLLIHICTDQMLRLK